MTRQVEIDLVFERFLQDRLATEGPERHSIERVARRAYYGAYYEALHPEETKTWSVEDEETERSPYLQLRVSPYALEKGQDLVATFGHEHPDRKYCYYRVAGDANVPEDKMTDKQAFPSPDIDEALLLKIVGGLGFVDRHEVIEGARRLIRGEPPGPDPGAQPRELLAYPEASVPPMPLPRGTWLLDVARVTNAYLTALTEGPR